TEWRQADASMKLASEDRTLTIPQTDIARLERMTRPGRARKGAGIGAAVLGGLIGGLVIYECSSDCCCDGGSVLAVVGAAGALGAGLGAVAGAGTKWADVPLASLPIDTLQLRFRISLVAHALGAGISISF
ncbi:MAG TPA: hypothetical protein VG758_18065, partial [Hyphomicrobiaceae bacterium]|nr:hypothetical protein [Hyphomicrobiaceae bacterium]